ncbi:MAG: outer membrane lipoprotein LolB [Woeseiaceae bacterium]|nr:outer membrane lipoprotein LolB [Woeseiaceae bacterium]
MTERSALLIVLLLSAAGCVTPKSLELPDLSEWDQRRTVLAEIDQYDFNGRIAVKAGDDGFNGKLRWTQDESLFNATVSGPLGIGTVRIAGDDEIVEITDKDGITTVLADVERDLYDRYGWTIPVESLRYWALGIPDPRVPAETHLNETGELAQLSQRGWSVTVSRYREAGGGQVMPRLLTASNTETSVRLVIDRWVFRETVAP